MNQSLLMCVAVIVSAPAIKDTLRPPAIVGEWEMWSLKRSGELVPPGPEPIRYSFTADGKWITACGTYVLPGQSSTYETYEKTNPPRIDLIVDPKHPDQRSEGIFKIEDDTLTMCFAIGSGKRPTQFESAADKPTSLYVFKRVKKE